jgi:chromosomal replication initiator protein
MRQIMLAVAAATGVTATEIRSPRRNTRIVRARFMCFWLSRKLTSYSFPQIGRFTGNKDHSTVMHGIGRVVEDRAYFEPELSQVEAALSATGGAP